MAAYLTAVWAIMQELAPWLLFGAAVAGALHVLMPADFIRRQLGGRGPWTTVKAALVGVPMPLCSCAVIPTGLGLRRDGAGRGAAVSFLISTPQTGVDSVMVTAAFLGWPFALFKLAAAFLTGVTGGLLANAFDDEPPSEVAGGLRERPTGSRLARAWRFAVEDLLRTIWIWLLIGVLVSALITTMIPQGAIGAWGITGIAALLLTVLISLPLYVCATASVPIAAALVQAGLPSGAALVFLMAGPATNVATIGATSRALGWRTTWIYLATILAGSVGLGLAYDALLGLQPMMDHAHHHHHHHHGGPIFFWSAVALSALLAYFAISDLRRWVAGLGAAKSSCCAEEPEPAASSCCGGESQPEPEPVASSCCGGESKPEPAPAASSCCGGESKPEPAPAASSCCGGESKPEPAPAASSCCGGESKPEPAPAASSCCGGEAKPKAEPVSSTSGCCGGGE